MTCREREAAMARIAFTRKPPKTAAAMSQLRALAAPLPLDLKKVFERDAVLKLALLLPEDVLGQALAVGRALQACAEHRRTIPGDRQEGCRK